MAQPPSSSARWAGSVRFFHWTSAALLVVVWLMIFLHESTADENFMYISLHKALGVSFFFWILARFINRFAHKSQDPAPVAGPRWQQLLASLVHSLLYVVLLMMPLAGFLMSQYGGRAVSMFGLFEIPLLVVPDRETGRFFHDLHTDILWPLILLLTASHILAALHHQFVKKDRLINRMR